jgi:N-acetylmuramoyl-L-alanine amidase
MPWSSRSQAIVAAVLLLSCALLLCVAEQDKQLTVYAPQKTYDVEVQDRDGQLYLNLSDLLVPLGSVAVRTSGKEARLQFNEVESWISDGQDKLKIKGKQVDLGGYALVENDRVLVPLGASFPILSALLNKLVEFHPSGRRIFLDGAGTRFTAELKKSDKSILLLTFNQPVSPAVEQDEDRLKLTFKREPVVSDITNQPFDDKTIHSLSFSEENGSAFLTIAGGPGLKASLSSDRRSLTVQVPPPGATAAPEVRTLLPPVTLEGQSEPSQPAAQNSEQHPNGFFVLIDPGHGGDDAGAQLGGKLQEKDLTLAMAKRLKSELQDRGIPARLLRETDVTLSLDQRAAIANQQHAGIYIAIHAGTPGEGVRIYAPAIPSSLQATGKFLPWEDAQVESLARSRLLARTITAELARKKISSTSMRSLLRPLNNVLAPAVAVELALNADRSNLQEVTGQKFQLAVAAGVASGIAQSRSHLGEEP